MGAPGPVPWLRPTSQGSRSLFLRFYRARPATTGLGRAPRADARGSNTNTTPRFRDAAAAGGRRGRAGVWTRQAPATYTGTSPSPREASGRACARNLIKSKQTQQIGKGERPESKRQQPGLTLSLLFSDPFAQPGILKNQADFHLPSRLSPPAQAVAAERRPFAVIAAHRTPPLPRPPFPSWRQTESTNQ